MTMPEAPMLIYDVACLAGRAEAEMDEELTLLRRKMALDGFEVEFYADWTSEEDLRVLGAIARVWPGATVKLFDGP